MLPSAGRNGTNHSNHFDLLGQLQIATKYPSICDIPNSCLPGRLLVSHPRSQCLGQKTSLPQCLHYLSATSPLHPLTSHLVGSVPAGSLFSFAVIHLIRHACSPTSSLRTLFSFSPIVYFVFVCVYVVVFYKMVC